MTTSASLQALLDQGLDHAGLAFGADASPVRAAELAVAGQAHFRSGSPAPAVAALLTNDRPSVELVLGAIVTGTRLVSLPLPARGDAVDDYLVFVREACERHGVREVVARDDVAVLLESAGIAVRPHADLARAPLAAPGPEGFELVQYSSGSTGRPKGIGLGDRELGANVAAILEGVGPRPGDCTVTWLPLSHDMGLIGMLLTSIAAAAPQWVGRGDIVILTPESFLRSPGTWVDTMSRWRGTFTAAPDFALRLAARTGSPEGLDLSSVRCLIVGGEIVRGETLEGFHRAFRGTGLSWSSLCPSYGMAEIGLAVTMTRPGSGPHLTSAGHLGPAWGHASSTVLVGSGAPLPGYRVEVADPADGLGQVQVTGPSIGRDARTGAPLAGADGVLRTNDLGFVDDGQLVVCGRDDDYLVVNGRNLHAPSLDERASAVEGIRPGRAVAVADLTGRWAVIAEPDADPVDVGALRRSVGRAVAGAGGVTPDDVVIVRRGTLPLTTSGKMRRGAARSRWLTGALDEV